ncbi:MAG: organomercurial transporter MerC, partial [Gammaproteobacteria bacterium]|nr:organomercurial transporter MerC [Gammaproteobacteria bacterium]
MLELVVNALARVADKIGALGTVGSTMGCAMCFPALASIGSAAGLGFLAQWEGLLVNTLLPVFALVALAANALGWLAHRQWHRSLLGIAGPAAVLLTLYPLWPHAWSTYLLYAGLALMLGVAAWDLLSPARRRCATD